VQRKSGVIVNARHRPPVRRQ